MVFKKRLYEKLFQSFLQSDAPGMDAGAEIYDITRYGDPHSGFERIRSFPDATFNFGKKPESFLCVFNLHGQEGVFLTANVAGQVVKGGADSWRAETLVPQPVQFRQNAAGDILRFFLTGAGRSGCGLHLLDQTRSAIRMNFHRTVIV
jgi:hypothetical protein